MEDITTQFINDVVLMSDKDLMEDRSQWIKMYGKEDKEYPGYEDMIYETSMHTLAIEIEQVRRFGKIIYIVPKELTEQTGSRE
jgi:hypothetical protein